MTSAPEAAIAESRASLRDALVAQGFADDGELLRGPVRWQGPNGAATATVDITLTDRYPFGPPVVRLHSPGDDLTVTFHVDPDDALCLWDNTEPAGDASWTDAEGLLERIGGWLDSTAAGWPGDDDTDLERYVPNPRAPQLVLYDADALGGVTGCVRTTANDMTLTVLSERQIPPARSRTARRGQSTRHGKTSLPRKQQHLAYIADIGSVGAPIRDWDDLAAVLAEPAEVKRYIQQGAVELLVLRYSRSTATGILALAVVPGRDGKPPQLRPCLTADTSVASRTLRAGPQASAMRQGRVAVVGCGAVGSYITDLLYREGVRRFWLVDPDIYRPGNAIRHAAPAHLVGLTKVAALKASLALLGLDEADVTLSETRLCSPSDALLLLHDSDLVVDATADERATALLRWAAESTGKVVVSACVQRDGGIARVDRFPLRGAEQHLPPVPLLTGGQAPLRERGCGDTVSPTCPSAVVAAAELAVELTRDHLSLEAAAPASMVRVLQPQPDVPYTTLGMITAASLRPEAS